MAELDLKSVNQTGVIISLTREIENLMTRLGANALGLHDKTDMLSSKLTPECIKLLHYIGAVRNQSAHEALPGEDFDMDFFISSCDSVILELKSLNGMAVELPETVDYGGKIQLAGVENIDRDFLMQLKFMLKISAFIPFLHVIFPIGGLIRTIWSAIDKILGIIFYLSSLVIMLYGLMNHNYHLLTYGGVLYGGVYLYGAFSAIKNRREIPLHLAFALVPLLNLSYFLYCCAVKINLGKTFFYLALISSYFCGFELFFNSKRADLGLIIFGSGYVAGVIAALFYRIKQN